MSTRHEEVRTMGLAGVLVFKMEGLAAVHHEMAVMIVAGTTDIYNMINS